MKKLFLLGIFSFLFSFSADASLGCGGVCIYTDTLNRYVGGMGHLSPGDSISMPEGGEVVIYASYNDCCEMLFGPAASIDWYLNGSYYTTTIASGTSSLIFTATLTVTEPGTYTANFNGYGLSNTCRTVEVLIDAPHTNPPVAQPVIAVQTVDDNGISVFPNPATTDITVTTYLPSVQTITTRIFSYNGKELNRVDEASEGSYSKTIDISTLPAGIYFYSVRSNGVSKSGKLVKQ